MNYSTFWYVYLFGSQIEIQDTFNDIITVYGHKS